MKRIVATAAAFIVAALLSPSPVLSPVISLPTTPPIKMRCDILAAIQEAHELLTVAEPHRGKGKEEIPLILLDTEECTLGHISVIRDRRGGIPNESEYPFPRLEETGWCPEGCWNGVNTPLQVSRPWVVVSLRWRNYIYTPFSTELIGKYPELIEGGEENLENYSEEAIRLLRERRVPSLGIPGMLVADVAEELNFKKILRAIPLIEHVDMRDLHAWARGTLPYNPFKRVLGIIGANGDRAYRFSVSAMGARGLYQIWPKTCEELRRAYPSAHLPRGCNDSPVVGAMSAVLHMDRDIRAFGNRVYSYEDLTEAFVASYNSGPERTKDNIREGRIDRTLFKPETQGYLQKFEVISLR